MGNTDTRKVNNYLQNFIFQIFSKNPECCWRIEPKSVQTIVNLVAHHQERVPGFVQVLSALITVDEKMTTLLKRNQILMMKYFLETYPRVAHVFEFSASRKYVFISFTNNMNWTLFDWICLFRTEISWYPIEKTGHLRILKWLICNQVISFYHFRRKILQNQEGSGMLRFFINHVNFLLLSGKVSIKELFSGVLY